MEHLYNNDSHDPARHLLYDLGFDSHDEGISKVQTFLAVTALKKPFMLMSDGFAITFLGAKARAH